MKIFMALFGFFLLALGSVRAIPLQSAREQIEFFSVIQLEEPCVRQGGICMRVEDCEPGNLVQVRHVLCPAQSHLGVDCCYI